MNRNEATESLPQQSSTRFPIAQWGWPQIHLFGWPLGIATVVLVWIGGVWQWVAVVPLALLLLILYFFRDPVREIPTAPLAFVSPADGKVVEVARLEEYEFFGGPAVRIGIFLSIFNVHVNRSPRSARALDTHHQPGQFLNAMNPESAERNEFTWIGFEESDGSRRRFAVRQVAGLVARRIVCDLRPGMTVQRGARFGMIKFGSRTELILPAEDVSVQVKVGDRVRGGSSILATWNERG